MTKLQFKNSNKPLVFISTINPENNTSTIDYVNVNNYQYFLENARKDFPERFTFYRKNNSAIKYLVKLITKE